MKKIVLTFLLAISLMAGYVDELKSYLLSKEFHIDGAFFLVQMGESGKWIYAALDDDGEVSGYYELLGTEPSSSNPFGWKPLSHAVPIVESKMMGYFIYIGFALDLKDPERKYYSWIFVDAKSGAIYKLMGQKNGYFQYLQQDGVIKPLEGIFFHKEGSKAVFYSCSDSFENNLSIRKFSKQSGAIGYECRVGTPDPYRLFEPLEPKEVVVLDHIEGQIVYKRVVANVTKKPLEGTIHIEGIVGDRSVDCLRRYKPLASQKIFSDWQLRYLADWRGEGAKIEEQGSCEGVEKLLAKPLFVGFRRTLTIQENNATSSLVFWKDIYRF